MSVKDEFLVPATVTLYMGYHAYDEVNEDFEILNKDGFWEELDIGL